MIEHLASWYTQQGLDIRDVVLPNGEIMRGLHATRDFFPGETVFTLEWEPDQVKGVYQGREGRLVPFGDSYDENCSNRGIPVSPKWVFCPDPSHPLYWYNHSCEPNTAVTQFGPIKKRFRGKHYLEFKAIRHIKKGEHLTIDYAGFSSINCGDAPGLPYHLECACGAANCRSNQGKVGYVTGLAHEGRKTQELMIKEARFLAFLIQELLESKTADEVTENYLWSLVSRSPQRLDRYKAALLSQLNIGKS